MARGWPPVNDEENPVESLLFTYCYYSMFWAAFLGTYFVVRVVKMVQKPYFDLFDENGPPLIQPPPPPPSLSKSAGEPETQGVSFDL